MKAVIDRFKRDQSGASSVEYALIATIIGIGIIVSVGGIRDGLNDYFNNVRTALEK